MRHYPRTRQFFERRILAGAATGALALGLLVLPAGTSFAKGPAGGSSSSHMSEKGLSNTNGPNSSDRDTGLGRAEDRANEKGLENSKALSGAGDSDEGSGNGKGKGKGKNKGKHKGAGKGKGDGEN